MIEKFLEHEKVIVHVPIWQDIDVLESINKAVKPLQGFTDALSGESFVCVSYIKLVFHLFKTSLQQPEEEDTELIKTIQRNNVVTLWRMNSWTFEHLTDGPKVPHSLHWPRQGGTRQKSSAVMEAELILLPTAVDNSSLAQLCRCAKKKHSLCPRKRTSAAFFKKNVSLVSSLHDSEVVKILRDWAENFLIYPWGRPWHRTPWVVEVPPTEFSTAK